MRALLSNFHFSLRLLRRSPRFFALVLGLLTAGIGATTTVLSLVEPLLLRPLPYPRPESLTEIVQVHLGEHTGVSEPNFIDWRAQGTTFERMAAVAAGSRS